MKNIQSKQRLTRIFLGLAFFLMGILGITGAFFSSSATSSGNMLASGSLDILLSDIDESESTDISGTWAIGGLVPGGVLPEAQIAIKNGSEIEAHHLDLEFSYTGSEELAKNIIFANNNSGFRYGASDDDGASVKLISQLKGSNDTDYSVYHADGLPINANEIDGIDGSTEDGNISLHELSEFGKFRIQPGTESAGIAAQSTGYLWLNAIVSEELTEQNVFVDIMITATLEQDESQL